MCERELETEQNCIILTPSFLAITAFLSRSPGLLNRGPGGPASLGAGFLYCILSLTRLIPNSSDLQLVWSPTDWISCALSYIIVQHPPSSCGRHNFALIQPVHGQGYNILIFLDRMDLLFTQVHFLFWQPGRVVGQYTTTKPNQTKHFLYVTYTAEDIQQTFSRTLPAQSKRIVTVSLAQGKNPYPKMKCPGYVTKLHLMIRHYF